MSAPSPPGDADPGTAGSFKAALTRFTERFGHLMSRILLTLLYVVLVAPAGLVLSLFGDRLDIRRYRGSSWVPCGFDNETLDRARRQD